MTPKLPDVGVWERSRLLKAFPAGVFMRLPDGRQDTRAAPHAQTRAQRIEPLQWAALLETLDVRLSWCARGYSHHAHHSLLRSIYRSTSRQRSGKRFSLSYLLHGTLPVFRLCASAPLRLGSALRLCSSLCFAPSGLASALHSSLLCSSRLWSASSQPFTRRARLLHFADGHRHKHFPHSRTRVTSDRRKHTEKIGLCHQLSVDRLRTLQHHFDGNIGVHEIAIYIRRLRSSRKLQVWWQANQSLKTISIYRRKGVNNDCGAGRCRPFWLADRLPPQVRPQYSLWSSFSVVPPTACGDGGRFGVSQARKYERAIKSRQQTGSQRAVGD